MGMEIGNRSDTVTGTQPAPVAPAAGPVIAVPGVAAPGVSFMKVAVTIAMVAVYIFVLSGALPDGPKLDDYYI